MTFRLFDPDRLGTQGTRDSVKKTRKLMHELVG